jgi:antitoxin PrlF
MTTLTQKAQVTIPKQFRVVLGLRPGDEVDFEMERGKLVLRKKARKLPFEKWRGVLKGYTSRQFNEEFR